MMKHLLLCIMLLSAIPGYTQLSFTNFDIDTRTDKSSNPQFFTEFKGKTYFIAQDSLGIELRRHDAGGVAVVEDLVPGPGYGAAYRPIHTYKGKLYFAGGNNSDGIELYQYDGNNAPSLVVDIQPGVFSSFPHILGISGDQIFFTDSSANTQNLYLYDLNTQILKRLTGKQGQLLSAVEKEGTLYNGKLYFAGVNNITGTEPYVYDPISDSITLLDDINMGPGTSQPTKFRVIHNKLYFSILYANPASNDHIYGVMEYDGINTPKNILSKFIGTYYPNHARILGTYTYRYNKFYVACDTSMNHSNENTIFELDPATGDSRALFTINSHTVGGSTVYSNKLFYNSDGSIYVYDFNNPSRKIDTINGLHTGSYMLHSAISNNSLYYAGLVNHIPFSIGNNELCIIYDSTVSIPERYIKEIHLTAYPNPVTGDAHLSFSLEQPQTLSVTLTNINGQVVYRKEAQLYSKGKHQLTIPMQDLPTGNYIYTVRDNNGTMTNSGKLLKQ